jgi:O-antigen ligase
MITILLLLGALICFALAAFSVPVPKINMIGLGLALLTLLWLLQKVGGV